MRRAFITTAKLNQHSTVAVVAIPRRSFEERTGLEYLRVLVRMILFAKRSVRFLDFTIRCSLVKIQKFVIVFSAEGEGNQSYQEERVKQEHDDQDW